MRKARRFVAMLSVVAGLLALAPAAHADGPPGPASQPQCAGGQFPGSNGNPHCPQN
jgi:hypothetical protein